MYLSEKFGGGDYMSDEKEYEQVIRVEDEYGNILIYSDWSKKNSPKDEQNKWEVPSYI